MLFQFKDITYCLGSNNARCITASGDVENGETLVVRGPSGSGKSTLLRILSRLQPCKGGEAYLSNSSWQQIPATTWRTAIHYVAQKPAIFDGTVAQNLAIPFETTILKNKIIFNIDYAKKLLNDLLLPSNLLDQNAKTLSGGEAARMAFARALLVEPSILLLDEPTAALDSKARDAFYNVLSQWLTTKGRAALLISHTEDYQVLEKVKHLDISKEI